MADFNGKYTGAQIDALLDKADTAIQNIKSINGESLVGEGNIDINIGEKDDSVYVWNWGWDENSDSHSGSITEEELNALLNAEIIVLSSATLRVTSNVIMRFDAHTAVLSATIRMESLVTNIMVLVGEGDDGYMYNAVMTYEPPIPTNTSQLENDSNFVSSDGLKTINGESIVGEGEITISSGGSGAYAEVNHGTGDTTFTLTPNTFHIWDEVESLTLTFGGETSGVANEFLFQFTSGATATMLSLPNSIKWANDTAPTIAENMIYQISVLRGLASVLEFSNAVALIDNLCTLSGTTLSFQYPTASDLTVSIGMDNVEVPAGTTSYNIDIMIDPDSSIKYIIPSADNTYNYIF